MSSERADRMRVELENMDIRLEEEKKRSAELLLQVRFPFSDLSPLVLVYQSFSFKTFVMHKKVCIYRVAYKMEIPHPLAVIFNK